MTFLLKAAKINFEQEKTFYPGRKWRLDFYLPEYKIGIECEGGIWQAGRHNRAVGFIKDCYKYNAAAEVGIIILRYTTEHIFRQPGQVIEQIKKVIKRKQNDF